VDLDMSDQAKKRSWVDGAANSAHTNFEKTI